MPLQNMRTAKRAITVKEIRKIEKLNLPAGSSLDKARDLFFISFYLRGMAFVDMARGTPHMGKCSFAHEYPDSHHQRGHGTQLLQDHTDLLAVDRRSNHQ